MKVSIILPLFEASLALAAYQCPVMPQAPGLAIQYAYTIQTLMQEYYFSVPVNTTFFSDLPNATAISPINGMTLAENTVTNVNGLTKQAELGSEALRQFWGSYDSTSLSYCNYNLPAAATGLDHLKMAYFFEASLCGAFIGLAEVVQAPQAAFLMARLAAEHGVHASAIRGMMQAVGFHANSTSLLPAFAPSTVLMSNGSREVGMLGSFLGGCASAPPNPCNGTIVIGPLLAELNDQMSGNAYTPMPVSMPMPATSTPTM